MHLGDAELLPCQLVVPRATRRQFLAKYATTAVGAWVWPALARAAVNSAPALQFPSEPRERVAIASYPFRKIIISPSNREGTMDLKDFAAHVGEAFQIHKIEPWSKHFTSTQPKYLEELRSVVDRASSAIVNVAVDSEHSPNGPDRLERERAIAFSKKWVDVAVAIGSPSIRTNLPNPADSKPDLQRTAESLTRVAEYASSRNIVVTLENDDPLNEDPFFLVQVIEKVKNPWLCTLPDFGNTLASANPEYAYRGLDAMFGHAYCISHVKSSGTNSKGVIVPVDMAKAFGIMNQHDYKGYCSMEWDEAGDPYLGTAELIEVTLRYLSNRNEGASLNHR